MSPGVRWILSVASLLVAGGLCLTSIVVDRDTETSERRAELQEIERRCRAMESDNQRMRRHVRALSEDSRYLEKTARSEIGWIRDGERVYVFEPGPATKGSDRRKGAL